MILSSSILVSSRFKIDYFSVSLVFARVQRAAGSVNINAPDRFVGELSQVYFFGIQFSATPFSLADFLMLSRRKRIKSARGGTHEKGR